MSVASVTSQTQVYDSYNAGSAAKASDTAKKEEAAKKETTTAKTENEGVVYEKSEEKSDSSKKATYSVNKMSAEDRAALVQQLKADEQSRRDQLTSLVQQMMTKQATTYANANDIWKFLAKGTLKQWHLEDMDKISKDKSVVLLDVRTVGEFNRGHMDGFKNIPVDELRERINEIEKGKPVYLICQSGQDVEMGFIMVHAQDHLMTSLLFKDIIGSLIDVYRK